ncbi:Sporulation protein YpeB [[Clostridium] ultunense Esp]|nr:Sporulation protein YpeB [[Clostridium] ultunense Esp]
MGKIATILVPVLAVSLVGTTYWGYRENQEKNSILIKAENQYQQGFHDLTFYMDSLHRELGKSIAMNSRRQLGPCLTNVWRLSYAAQNGVGQLPLTLMPFNKTEEFLFKMGDFSFRTATRDLEKEPLTSSEWKTLKNLYARSGEIVQELRKVEQAIYDKKLRWMDVEQAIATEDKKMDHTIIDGFKWIDQRVDGFREIDFGMNTTSSEEIQIKRLENLTGEEISPEEAKQKALTFTGIKNPRKVKVTAVDKKGVYPVYDISILNGDDSSTLVEVTKRGGRLLWMMNTRPIKAARLSIENGEVKAYRFLLSHGWDGMENVKTERQDNTAIYTYAPREGGILLYPDMITVKVALDRGDVVGIQAQNYVANHRKRNLPKPTLSVQAAEKRLNPNFRVEERSLALVQNERNEEVLVYEFVGKVDKTDYQVFINAKNGEEEKIDHLDYVS